MRENSEDNAQIIARSYSWGSTDVFEGLRGGAIDSSNLFEALRGGDIDSTLRSRSVSVIRTIVVRTFL